MTDLLRLLEFDKIRGMVASRCHFSVAAERARELTPTADPEQVRYLLQVTREATRLLAERPHFSVGGFRDLRPLIASARRGMTLGATELRTVLDTLEAVANLRRQFFAIERWEERFPALSEFALAMQDIPDLRANLQRSIGPRGEVLDTASTELARIRKELKETHDRLLERLRRLLELYGDAVQEAFITVREGRYVIPVRADRRKVVPGISHDVSSSGQTIFVEPFEILEMNNRWRELQAAEAHEIERILQFLSRGVAEKSEALMQLVEAGAAFDLALAKARFGLDYEAVEPELLTAPSRVSPGGHPTLRVRLKSARHPLLDPHSAVPIDLELGERYRILVITGPNTGGKTVALKTVGLLALMTQAGLFIPAAPGSGLSVFPAIYVDIGDEQSIEQNLSTFSSHLRRVVATLREADQHSLVLLDELAAGTDPQEGAALARALLERLLELGVLGVVTTHYPELKAFAATTPGLENGSVEFDPVKLSPTFRLIIGVPGRSHALEIGRRLGLDEQIVARAEELLGHGSPAIDRLIAGLHARLKEVEEAAGEARRLRDEARELRERAEQALAQAERERGEVRARMLAELEGELQAAREIARKLQHLVESGKYPPPQVVEASLRALEEKRRQIRESAISAQTVRKKLAVGEWVELPTLGLEGEIVALYPESNEVEVQVGHFRVRQPETAVRHSGKVLSATREPATRTVHAPAPPPVAIELHLRGLHVHEALEQLDRYLDRALQAGLPYVRIVHGKGTGALRQAVHDFLREHPLVERWELASPYEGGHGVTIVYLRG